MWCFKSFFVSQDQDESQEESQESWSLLPEKLQLLIVEYLKPKDKARLSMTCKANHSLVKSIPIRCLQFDPFRVNVKKSLRVMVFFSMNEEDSLMVQFEQRGGDVVRVITENGVGEEFGKKFLDCDSRKMASWFLQGWLTGTNIETLDIRGEYTGRIPLNLKLKTFCFTEKVYHERRNFPFVELPKPSQIPQWLDSIEVGEDMHFHIIASKINNFINHRHFSNPTNNCILTAYDDITTFQIGCLGCKTIELRNILNETVFNTLLKKWSTGLFSESFEYLTTMNFGKTFKSEELLLDHRVRSLDNNIFKEHDKLSDRDFELMEYFLVSGTDDTFAVYSGMGSYANLRVVNDDLLEKIPLLHKFISENLLYLA